MDIGKFNEKFPAPLEVDRYLYWHFDRASGDYFPQVFPAPREVDRYLYTSKHEATQPDGSTKFPAPLEVDRYLYFGWVFDCEGIEVEGFRPLARLIGSYTWISFLGFICRDGVSGPSRGR